MDGLFRKREVAVGDSPVERDGDRRVRGVELVQKEDASVFEGAIELGLVIGTRGINKTRELELVGHTAHEVEIEVEHARDLLDERVLATARRPVQVHGHVVGDSVRNGLERGVHDVGQLLGQGLLLIDAVLIAKRNVPHICPL